MAGGIFHPAEDIDSLENYSRNPLLCYLCNELYEEPCLLACYHTFCSRCLRGRSVDGKMTCPLCGKETAAKDGGGLPPPDPLLHFLVESSSEERPPCANCDHTEQSQMFFCNTCGQALCSSCREETHRAKMFSQHDIIHMSKRTKEIHKRCSLHGEPYIMFSTAKRTMLCINCFRDTSIEARLHCIDLDTAYTQGCKKLERAVLSLRELQNSVRDGVILFRALLEELRRNMETEKNAIMGLCQTLQDIIQQTQHSLICEVDNQYENKDKLFRAQLASLGTLLPTIQVHLIMCTTFASTASKYEFLSLGYTLMERLSAIAHMSHPLRPSQSSQIKTNYKAEISRNLDPLITEKPVRELGVGTNGGVPSEGMPRAPAGAAQPGYGYAGARSRSHYQAFKMKILEGCGVFVEHSKAFEMKFREMMGRLSALKEQVQELHRDVTLRRCLTKRGRVEAITGECAKLEEELTMQQIALDGKRTCFDKAWEEQLQRVYAEQELFQAQMNELLSMRSENQRVMNIVQQLEPYIRSITSLMERISPRLSSPQGGGPSDPGSLEDCMASIIEQINTMQPESKQQDPVRQPPPPDFTPLRDDATGLLRKDLSLTPLAKAKRIGRSNEEFCLECRAEGDAKKGFLTQLLEKVRCSDEKKRVKAGDMAPFRYESRSSSRERHSAPEDNDDDGGFSAYASTRLSMQEQTKSDTEVRPTREPFERGRMYSTLPRAAHQEREYHGVVGGGGLMRIPPEAVRSSPVLERIDFHHKIEDNHDMLTTAGGFVAKPSGMVTAPAPSATVTTTTPVVRAEAKSDTWGPDSKQKVVNHYESLDELKKEVKALGHYDAPRPLKSPIKRHSSPESMQQQKSPVKKQSSCENFAERPRSTSESSQSRRATMKKQNSLESFISSSDSSVRKRQEQRKGMLKKADSFEGHEEAVKTLVAAVHESRTLRKKKTN